MSADDRYDEFLNAALRQLGDQARVARSRQRPDDVYECVLAGIEAHRLVPPRVRSKRRISLRATCSFALSLVGVVVVGAMAMGGTRGLFPDRQDSSPSGGVVAAPQVTGTPARASTGAGGARPTTGSGVERPATGAEVRPTAGGEARPSGGGQTQVTLPPPGPAPTGVRPMSSPMPTSTPVTTAAPTPAGETPPVYPTQTATSASAAPAGQVVLGRGRTDVLSLVGPGCDHLIEFRQEVSMTGSGRVAYQWLRSDGVTGPVEDVYFADAGTRSVTTTWRPDDISEGWQQVAILAPTALLGDRISFSHACPSGAAQAS